VITRRSVGILLRSSQGTGDHLAHFRVACIGERNILGEATRLGFSASGGAAGAHRWSKIVGMPGLKKTSRRRVRNALLALLLVVSVGLAVLMANGALDRNAKLAGIVSLFLGLPALWATVIKLFPAAGPTRSASGSADDLASTIQGQWYEEATVRGLRDPKVLPLTWSTDRMAGRMAGSFDETTRQLADAYQVVRSGRLVVLGEPGSGKTVLAILLTLGLLSSRRPGSAVPVLLAASSWDPIQESMDDWVIRTLAAEYYNGQQDIPRALHHHGLLLPILDGLDEIPESARRSAVHGINEAIGADRPVVVTCRLAEYDDVIEGGAPVLRRTPVVRVMPVAVGDVITYLKEVPSWPNGTCWDAVFADLQQKPEGPLAAALSTPLMVSLVRTVYQRCGGDPAELLDARKFDSRHKVEDYLIDRIIDAAYAPDLLPSGELAETPVSGWDATKARHWLTFLARYLHQHRERDLAWWRLSDRLVSPWMVPLIGIGLGVVFMIFVSAGTAALDSALGATSTDALGIGACLGAVVAVLGTVLWYSAVGRVPGRMAFAVRGSLGRLRRGFVAGAALVTILAVPVLFGFVVVVFISNRGSSDFSEIAGLVSGLMVAMAAACVVGFAMAAHNWLNALPERSVQASPFSFVQQDRRSSLTGALAAGLVASATMVPVFSVAILMGEILGQGFAGEIGETGTVELANIMTWLGVSSDSVVPVIWFAVVLPGMGITLLVLLTRAWPRFVLARALLAARGHLPWRLLTFLDDARRRNLIRQSGGMYQFRHVRLQERLTVQPGVTTRALQSPAPNPTTAVRRRRMMAMAGAMIIASTVVVTLSIFNYLRCDSWRRLGTDVDRVRSFTGSGSLCIGIVPEPQWNDLVPKRAVPDLLRNNEAVARGNDEVSTIAVLGSLRTKDPGMIEVIQHQLDGVLLAQRESHRLGRPVRIVLVDTGPMDSTDGYALKRVLSLSRRPGVNRLTAVDLNMTVNHSVSGPVVVNYLYDVVPPLFLARGFSYSTGGQLSPLQPDARTDFDRQLAESLMDSFIWFKLKKDQIPLVSETGILVNDTKILQEKCSIARESTFLYKEKPELIGIFLDTLMRACGTKNIQLVLPNSSVAEYLQRDISMKSYPTLTVYYPVEGVPIFRSCKAVAEEVRPNDAGVCADTDIVAESSYLVTLTAAGKGNYVVYEMKTDHNQWVSKVVQW